VDPTLRADQPVAWPAYASERGKTTNRNVVEFNFFKTSMKNSKQFFQKIIKRLFVNCADCFPDAVAVAAKEWCSVFQLSAKTIVFKILEFDIVS
jgi:hypothetical protein